MFFLKKKMVIHVFSQKKMVIHVISEGYAHSERDNSILRRFTFFISTTWFLVEFV